MIGVAVEGIIQLLFHVIFEIFFIGTGEIILNVFAIGKRKPVWKRETKGSSAKLGVLIDLSFIIGFVFWLSLAWFFFS
jgi:hypothetical protein